MTEGPTLLPLAGSDKRTKEVFALYLQRMNARMGRWFARGMDGLDEGLSAQRMGQGRSWTGSSCRRLRSAAKQSQNQALRSVRHSVDAGFTTAAQPNAASRARQLLQGISRNCYSNCNTACLESLFFLCAQALILAGLSRQTAESMKRWG
ncbi:hypothetical protein C5612_03755 [Pseudomonas frederiksbergensis]|uniref:Uncharacterized protein n=1 Tax=Pseudomonas frederiksbergensis TaxID=104087 RepID=A0A2S8HTL2_9PSED|nr:hypothetical protein C5612_03755 [Pseudomonas frederiksbergensis]